MGPASAQGLTSLGQDIPATHEWASRRSWPCLSSWPSSREAQAGELREILGPQPLTGVASGQLWAVFCALESQRHSILPELLQTTSLRYGQLVEENRCSRTSGHHLTHVGFPGNQNLGSLKTKVRFTPFRMFWLAVVGFEDHRSFQSYPPGRTLTNH